MQAPTGVVPDVEVPRYAAVLWLLCTVFILAVAIYGWREFHIAWLYTGGMTIFLLPMIFGALGLAAEILNRR